MLRTLRPKYRGSPRLAFSRIRRIPKSGLPVFSASFQLPKLHCPQQFNQRGSIMSDNKIKVWDLPVRVFHWLLVLGFFAAYFTEEDFLTAHVWAGYGVMVLLAFRLIWGFTGSAYARFSNFVCSPAQSVVYLQATVTGKAKRYIGHNPAGAAMIVLLLLSLALTIATGLAVYGAEERAGPLAGIIGKNGRLWEESHEFFADFALFLVAVHVCGVIFESWKHKENLIKAMITGYKSKTAPKKTASAAEIKNNHA